MFDAGGIKDPLFFIGVVERNDDPQLEGRIQVRAFGVHGLQNQVPTTELPWAVCVSGSYDPNTQPPPLNSFVWGMFLDGREAQHPMVLGLIPSQYGVDIDPEQKGWGVIPERDGEILAKGSDPKSWGQPMQSRLARGEDLVETYIFSQEMGRVENIKIANSTETWSEPAPAYRAQYPFNKVIETAKHCVEIDDTPNAERIMVWHKEGSYIQMDSVGNSTYKSTGDKFDVTTKNGHVYVGGQSHLHIDNDCTVFIKGNKTEEITGDYKLVVRGNAEFGVGGQLSINASDQLNARASEVRIQANVSNLSIAAAKDIKIQSQTSINTIAPYTRQTSTLSHNVQAGVLGYNLLVVGDYNASVNNFFVDATGAVPTLLGSSGVEINSLIGPAKFQSSTLTSIYGGFLVSIDNVVSLAGFSRPPSFIAGAIGQALLNLDFAEFSVLPEMPEPPGKSTSIVYRRGSSGTAGVTSGSISTSNFPGFGNPADIITNKADTLKPILDLIASAEANNGYDTIYSGIPESSLGGKKLTEMTVAEVLEWQEGLRKAGVESTAAGRYQFIYLTLKSLIPKYASLDDKFDAATQDKLAIGLMERDANLNGFLNGKISDVRFADNLSKIWAGLPAQIGSNIGRSQYAGIGSNKATTTINSVLTAVTDMRNRFNTFTSQVNNIENTIESAVSITLPKIFGGFLG